MAKRELLLGICCDCSREMKLTSGGRCTTCYGKHLYGPFWWRRSQIGVCDICQKEAKMVVDHDHFLGCPHKPTKRCPKCTRGKLCRDCNTGLGYFKDTPAILQEAVKYLKKHLDKRGD